MSLYGFLGERPCQEDWDVWITFWSEYTLENFALPRPLGRWIASTHCLHEWFYRADANILLRGIEGGARIFGR